MSYKELANALDKYDEDDKQRDKIAAILRSLDAQKPVGYWGGAFSGDGGADLYEVEQVSAFGRVYKNLPLYAAPVAAQPQQAKPEPLSDAEFAIDMLELMFTAYENGTPCYEDPDDEVGFMGYAFRLADDDFKNIGDFLNRVRPVQSGIKEQG